MTRTNEHYDDDDDDDKRRRRRSYSIYRVIIFISWLYSFFFTFFPSLEWTKFSYVFLIQRKTCNRSWTIIRLDTSHSYTLDIPLDTFQSRLSNSGIRFFVVVVILDLPIHLNSIFEPVTGTIEMYCEPWTRNTQKNKERKAHAVIFQMTDLINRFDFIYFGSIELIDHSTIFSSLFLIVFFSVLFHFYFASLI